MPTIDQAFIAFAAWTGMFYVSAGLYYLHGYLKRQSK